MMDAKMPPSHKNPTYQCGTCQWYLSGYEGNNCKKIRGVDINTQACVEYSAPLADPFREIVAHDKYVDGINKAFGSPKFLIDDTAILTELRSYIVDENVITFNYGSQQDPEAIIKALQKTISFRARVSNILTTLIDMQHDFQELQEKATLWIFSKYAMIRELKNESMRKTAFDRIFPSSVSIQVKLKKLHATASHIDSKLDRNERTLETILNSINYSRRHIQGFQR